MVKTSTTELDDIKCPKCNKIMLHWRDGEIALLFQCNCGYQEVVNLQTGRVISNDKK